MYERRKKGQDYCIRSAIRESEDMTILSIVLIMEKIE